MDMHDSSYRDNLEGDGMSKAVVAHKPEAECLKCHSTENLNMVIYNKQINTTPGYLLIGEHTDFDKDRISKFTFALRLSELHGIVNLCNSCCIMVQAELNSKI